MKMKKKTVIRYFDQRKNRFVDDFVDQNSRRLLFRNKVQVLYWQKTQQQLT
jgi:hypothetical protein